MKKKEQQKEKRRNSIKKTNNKDQGKQIKELKQKQTKEELKYGGDVREKEEAGVRGERTAERDAAGGHRCL